MICFKLCSLLVLSSLISCNALLQPLTFQTEDSLRGCVDKIIKRFTSNDITTIVYSLPSSESRNFESAYLNQFLRSKDENNSYTTIINDLNANTFNYFGRFKHPIGFVILLQALEELNTTLADLETEYETNRFLILFQFPLESSKRTISSIMKSFLQVNKLKIQIMVPQSNNNTSFVIYSWNQVCGRRRHNIIRYCSFGTFYHKQNVPYTRGRLDECPIRAGYVPIPPYTTNALNDQTGIEIKLVETISSVSHTTISYQQLPGTGTIYINGTTTGGFHSLRNGQVDIFFTGLRNTPLRTSQFRSTSFYLQNKIICCVPYVPYFNYGSNRFKSIANLPYIIICIVVMLLTTSLVMWCVSNQKHEVTAYKKISDTFLYNWAVLIGVAVYKLPKSSRVRILMGLFCVVAIVLNTFNSSYLTSLLATSRYIPKYNDIDDVLDDNATIFISQLVLNSLQAILSTSTDTTIEKICSNVKICNNETNCLMAVGLNNTPILISELRRGFLLQNTADVISSSMYCLQDAINKFMVTIYVRKGFSHLEEMNKVITRIFDVGLLAKWMKDLVGLNKPVLVSSNQAMIKMEHLLPVFQIYLIFNGLAVLVFLAEIIIGRKTK